MTTAVASRLPAPARVLIALVVLSGAVAFVVAVSWMLPMDEQHAFALLLIAGAVGLGAQMVLTFPHAGELEHFSLEESVWIAALVLAPRGVPTVGAIAGTVAWQYYRRTETHKIAFNAGQVAIAVLTAELTYGLIDRRDPTDPIAWLMAAVALALCSLINAGTVSLVISLIEGERFREVLLGPWRVNALSWLGNVSVGLLAAIAWDASPWGLALVAVPLGLLYVAYRGWMAQTVENELMEDIANAADEITRDGNLTMRLPMGEAAPRLAALTVTLNRMLERLEGSFLRQHHFMRDAAEELRDPVAQLRRSIDAAGDQPALRAELDRISRIVDDMGALARADSPGFVRPKPTALAPFLQDVATSAGPMLGGRLSAALPRARPAGRHRSGPHAPGAAQPAAERGRARRLLDPRGPARDRRGGRLAVRGRRRGRRRAGGARGRGVRAVLPGHTGQRRLRAGPGTGPHRRRRARRLGGHRQPAGPRRHVLGPGAGMRSVRERMTGVVCRGSWLYVRTELTTAVAHRRSTRQAAG